VAAPAVEAAPAGALVGASILVIAAWLTLVGLSKAYDYSLGAILREIADAANIRIWKVSIPLGSPIAKVDDRIRDSLAAGIQGLEYTIGRLWHGLEWLARQNANVLASFAHDVEQAFDGLVNGEIPQQVVSHTRTIVRRVDGTAHALDLRARRAEHAIYRGIDQLRRDLTREAQAARRGIDELTSDLAHVVLPGIRALDHRVDDVIGYTRKNLARRLTRVEKLVLGGAITAAALATLTRFFPFFRCTNVRSASRALCRMDPRLLETLLDATLIVGGTVSIRELAEQMADVMDPSVAAVRTFIREF
jgi:hypothetical protein